MRVIGIKVDKFKDKESENMIRYCQLHVAFIDKKFVGEAVEVLKIKSDLIDDVQLLSPGDEINISYNKFGRVESVTLIA